MGHNKISHAPFISKFRFWNTSIAFQCSKEIYCFGITEKKGGLLSSFLFGNHQLQNEIIKKGVKKRNSLTTNIKIGRQMSARISHRFQLNMTLKQLDGGGEMIRISFYNIFSFASSAVYLEKGQGNLHPQWIPSPVYFGSWFRELSSYCFFFLIPQMFYYRTCENWGYQSNVSFF